MTRNQALLHLFLVSTNLYVEIKGNFFLSIVSVLALNAQQPLGQVRPFLGTHLPLGSHANCTACVLYGSESSSACVAPHLQPMPGKTNLGPGPFSKADTGQLALRLLLMGILGWNQRQEMGSQPFSFLFTSQEGKAVCYSVPCYSQGTRDEQMGVFLFYIYTCMYL